MGKPSDAASSNPYLETRIGHYQLVREIGRGGMGSVFEAVHDQIGQRVAVKIVSLQGARSEGYYERFEKEARAACTVRHPGLVHVFDSGRLHDGTPFMMMELIEGESLRTRIDRAAPFAVDLAISITRQVAAALSVVHAAGIIHRDVKPENILLSNVVGAEPRAKLVDFGVAKVAGDSQLTRPGLLLGTPIYMSPEQCLESSELTPATDIYALGVVLYEMLCGVPPFSGAVLEVLRHHGTSPIPETPLQPLPQDVRELVLRMLSKRPSHRPAAEIVAGGHPLPSTPSARTPVQIDPGGTTGNVTPTLTYAPTAVSARPPSAADERRRRRRGAGIVAATLMVCGAVISGGLLAGRARRQAATPRKVAGMVFEKGGEFTLGRTDEEIESECSILGAACVHEVVERARRAHKVTLRPFYLDVEEVTNGEFFKWLDYAAPVVKRASGPVEESRVVDAVTGRVLVDLATPSGFELTEKGTEKAGERFTAWHLRQGAESLPVELVSWDAARSYCRWRGKRLPTEAEWEFAARGNTSRVFPWGDAVLPCADANLGRMKGERCSELPGAVVPANEFGADVTPEGVHNLGGNVAEWVEDAFRPGPYVDCGACTDPVEKASTPEDDDFRIVRGGSWRLDVMSLASARGRWRRDSPARSIGFRCAMTASD